MADCTVIEPGRGRVVLLIIAHADDMTLFCGGTVACWVDAGWRVVVVRATDDRWDSVGVDEEPTIAANRTEFERAAQILGVADIVDLGYPTDCLADVSEVELREKIIRCVRRFRPYALVTFDQYGMFHEDNQDHLQVAAAVDEAFWTSQFDKHHPEHFDDGLAPHGAFERWYFARRLVEVTDVVDISGVLDRKIDAALAHEMMMRHFVHQLQLQADTGGWTVPVLNDARDGDLRPLLEPLLRAQAERAGAPHDVHAAEEWRVVRFGGLGALLERFGVRRDER